MTENLLFTLLALFFVLLNGFFVAAEFAIVKLRLTQAAELAAAGGLRSRLLLNVRSNLDAYLSACQLGITLASLGLGWIGEPAFAELIRPLLHALGVTSPDAVRIASFAVAFATISYLHIVLGELAPKSIAIRQPQTVSLLTAAPLFAFYWLMYPFIYVLNGSAILILKTLGVELATEGDDAHSLTEIKQVLIASHRHGALDSDAVDMLSRAIELDKLTAGDLMWPADEMIALDAEQDLSEILATIRKHRYSRYPVYSSTPENLIGILHIKDLLLHYESIATPADLQSLLHPVLSIHDGVSAITILRNFREGATRFVLVVDEYGAVEGFVTMDHILETLIGNIQDEFSHRKPGWQRQADGRFRGSGALSIYSMERLLGIEIEQAAELDINSVGGLIMHKLESVPTVGQVVRFDGFELEVLDMKGPKINAVAVRPLKAPAD